jgi:hypothetical protein
MAAFINFLHYECVAIQAFIDEVGNWDSSLEEDANIDRHIAQFPELKDYFTIDPANFELNEFDGVGYVSLSTVQQHKNDVGKKSEIEVTWSKSLRLMIVEHLLTFDINISLLINVVETY